MCKLSFPVYAEMALKRGHTAFPKPPAYSCLPVPRTGVTASLSLGLESLHQSAPLVSGAPGPGTCLLLPSLPRSHHRAGPPTEGAAEGGEGARARLSMEIPSQGSRILAPCDCPGPPRPLPSTQGDPASPVGSPPSSRRAVCQKVLPPPAVASRLCPGLTHLIGSHKAERWRLPSKVSTASTPVGIPSRSA